METADNMYVVRHIRYDTFPPTFNYAVFRTFQTDGPTRVKGTRDESNSETGYSPDCEATRSNPVFARH